MTTRTWLSPAVLFLRLWRIAETWDSAQRFLGGSSDPALEKALASALAEDEAHIAYFKLLELVGSLDGIHQATRRRVLSAMRAIDEAFHLIHPRSPLVSPAAGRRARKPLWLKALRDERTLYGTYASFDDCILVPRGPLLRGPRGASASSAEKLADRFAALSVVPKELMHDGRPIALELKPISASASSGVMPGANSGAEVVAFIPVGEKDDDIVATERVVAGQRVVNFNLRASSNAAQCILDVLNRGGQFDIVLAPEFMVSESRAVELGRGITFLPKAPRLLIAGSGETSARAGDQGWNEARAFNSIGTELWRQRKIWPAGIQQARAIQLGLSDPGKDGLIQEDTAAGNSIQIVDADGVGRCVILICQDIELPLTNTLIECFQPDWVFVPILDVGVDIGRWMHATAFRLSSIAQSRFLVASSTSLADKIGNKDPHCGLAIGPKEPVEIEDRPRATALVKTNGSTPGFAEIRWRDGRWLITKLTAE
ncbi:hypothetical protein [Methylocystis parvus]|uniref:hypothetical protein n=1 Tax=Methylocystis parvus TaxID=134 RepID=UPI003C730DCF